MTDQTSQTDQVLAEGVDEEPIEGNRRLFVGRAYTILAALAFAYAAFHMAALNGLSISGLIATPWSVQATMAENAAQEGFEDLRAALGPEGEAFTGNSMRRLMALAEEVAQTADNADEIRGLAAEITIAQSQAAELRSTARDIKATWADRLPFLPTLPMEPWNFRMIHIAGALVLGFLLFSAYSFPATAPPGPIRETRTVTYIAAALALPALVAAVTTLGFIQFIGSDQTIEMGGRVLWMSMPEIPENFAAYDWVYDREIWWFGLPLLLATFGAIVTGWYERRDRAAFTASDIVLGLCALIVALYLIPVYGTAARNAVGTPQVPIGVAFAATAGTALILELTRRVAGMALVVIAGVFLVYTFTAHLLPSILRVETPYSWQRFFGTVYSDVGILGTTTSVSSTYIILFIIFAAFLQASKVGDYFVNFAFALAGRSRGGPAKVAIFASGLMGMINGTSAGNVVATGSLTIPLMKKVGYQKKTAGAIEAAASTGGQIMPPIMGAGAFIMAEVTGIPYTEIAAAAIIPAILYFASIYFMVDMEAAKLGMRGMREDELPKLRKLARQVFLFIPIIILIVALFMGYSVIRAGTLATVAAAVVSWLTPYRMGIRSIIKAFELAGIMSIQIIAVCAAAGIIVGVISLTGVGARFSNLLLDLAGVSQLLALFFAMCIAILLGMGMPTTAALCGGRRCRRARPREPRHPALDGAFLRLLLRRRLGHHAPRGAGQLRRGGHLGRQPDGDLGRFVPDRHRGLHRALHVLLQWRALDGRHVVRGDPGRHHRHLRRLPPVGGGAGLVHGRTLCVVLAHRPGLRGALHDRGWSGHRSGRPGARGRHLPDPAPVQPQRQRQHPGARRRLTTIGEGQTRPSPSPFSKYARRYAGQVVRRLR